MGTCPSVIFQPERLNTEFAFTQYSAGQEIRNHKNTFNKHQLGEWTDLFPLFT